MGHDVDNCPAADGAPLPHGPCICTKKYGEAFKAARHVWVDPRHSWSRSSSASVQEARAALKAAGKRWKDAHDWAVSTGHPDVPVLLPSVVRPGVVADFLAALGVSS